MIEYIKEAKKRYGDSIYDLEAVDAFVEGAKWHAERSYSEEELKSWLVHRDLYLYNYYTTYIKSGIPLESVEDFIKEHHEYLMDRKQFKKEIKE